MNFINQAMNLFTTPVEVPNPVSACDVLSPNSEWNTSNVVVHAIDLPWEASKRFCIVLDNILTPQECSNLISLSERVGYSGAQVNVGGGRQELMTDVRNNDRSIIDNPEITEQIWQRVLIALRNKNQDILNDLIRSPWVAARRGQPGMTCHAVGLNERMRFLRYDPDTYFVSHCDGSYVRGPEAGEERRGETSNVTFQLYLNEGFGGGATRFLSMDSSMVDTHHYDVIPKTGSVLLFQHNCFHEGSMVTSGRKYAVRTDVMYTNKGPGFEYANGFLKLV
jgi:hypothetical protein